MADKADALDKLIAPRTASGPIVTFGDGIAGAPVQSLVVNIEPVQEGEGDPSPENVRPITGWTGAVVKRYGADESDNLLTLSIPFGEAGTVYGGTLDVTTGLLTVTHGFVTMTGAGSNNSGQRFLGKSNRTGRNEYYAFSAGNSIVYQPDDDPYNSKYVMCSHAQSGASNNYICCFLASRQFRIAFPLNDPLGIDTTDKANAWLAEQYDAGTPVQFRYMLATPVTYQLTPQEVTTLLGINNIYADCGDVSVTYRGDLANLYALNAKKADSAALAPEEATATATRNYALGDFLTLGGRLYKATAAIASGETVTPWTNVAETTVAEQLTALWSAINT